jgi:hypothetical protein
MKATSIRYHSAGKAYWYAIAETSLGPMFVKVPLLEKGGTEGNWREYVAMLLAAAIGLPTLQPHAVEVGPELLSGADRDRTFWGLGNCFTGTPFQRHLKTGRGYDELTVGQRALLYAFDNLLYYSDRARPSVGGRQDCWLGDDGRPLLFDWDVYPAPDQSGPGNSPEIFGWDHCGKFLALQMRQTEIDAACVVVASLPDHVVRDVVTQAAAIWSHVTSDVTAWILARRGNLVRAAQSNPHPPWLP